MKHHKVRDNALKAAVRSPMFKMQQQTPKKGKGSYSRKERHTQKERHATREGVMRGHRQAA